jgi:hypothetical protein
VIPHGLSKLRGGGGGGSGAVGFPRDSTPWKPHEERTLNQRRTLSCDPGRFPTREVPVQGSLSRISFREIFHSLAWSEGGSSAHKVHQQTSGWRGSIVFAAPASADRLGELLMRHDRITGHSSRTPPAGRASGKLRRPGPDRLDERRTSTGWPIRCAVSSTLFGWAQERLLSRENESGAEDRGRLPTIPDPRGTRHLESQRKYARPRRLSAS